MFIDNLSNLSSQPYSYEIGEIVKDAMFIFQRECEQLANQGHRSICTIAKYYDVDHEPLGLYFGNWSRCYKLRNVPDSMMESVYARTQELIRAKLREAGFVGYAVEGVSEGPLYFPIYLFGRPSFLLDKSNPKYKKTIQITARW